MHYIHVHVHVQYSEKARVEACGADAKHAAANEATLHTMDEGRCYTHGTRKQTLLFSLCKRRIRHGLNLASP